MPTEKADIFTWTKFGDLNNFKNKLDKNKINEISKYGSGLLHYAISGEKFDIALYLIDNGIDLNLVNKDGQTALHLICIWSNIEIAKNILEKGGDLNMKDKYGNNPIWTATLNCKGRYYDMVELFMKYNPDIHSKNKAGRSPLDFAKQVNDTKLIKLLLKEN